MTRFTTKSLAYIAIRAIDSALEATIAALFVTQATVLAPSWTVDWAMPAMNVPMDHAAMAVFQATNAVTTPVRTVWEPSREDRNEVIVCHADDVVTASRKDLVPGMTSVWIVCQVPVTNWERVFHRLIAVSRTLNRKETREESSSRPKIGPLKSPLTRIS